MYYRMPKSKKSSSATIIQFSLSCQVLHGRRIDPINPQQNVRDTIFARSSLVVATKCIKWSRYLPPHRNYIRLDRLTFIKITIPRKTVIIFKLKEVERIYFFQAIRPGTKWNCTRCAFNFIGDKARRFWS